MKAAELLFDAHRTSLPPCSERTAAHRRDIGEDRARPEAEIE